MRVVTLMFDTLRRDVLPQYGGNLPLPNFDRLEEKCITFDNFYAGSLPCMPARRDMLTGHPNFLHRGWSPIEPFDTCFTEVLKQQGVYSHLITDHQHYWEDGGATYHNRYDSYEFVRGQEGDLFKAMVDLPETILEKDIMKNAFHPLQAKMFAHDEVNRLYMQDEKDYPQTQCVNLGLEFLETNKDADNWYLQVECFDPHEPFFVPDRFKDMIDPELKNKQFDWPSYKSTRSLENPADIETGYDNYKALLLMIDEYLGKYLDFFDEHDMWKDTVLLLNTDHGFMFGEKEWSGKSVMPVYEEIGHTPFLLHVPGCELNGTHVDCIGQTWDIPATMYDLFNVENAPETYGKSLIHLAKNDDRPYGITGYFGGHINIFDKKYTYMRGSKMPHNMPLKEYTLMPMRMRSMFTKADFKNTALVKGYSYFKDWDVLEVDSMSMFYSPFASGNMLFDRDEDPKQLNPIDDIDVETKFINLLKEFMKEVDTPESQYTRLGLDGDVDVSQERIERAAILSELNEGIDPSLITRELQSTLVNVSLLGKKDVILEAIDNGCKTTIEMKKYAKQKYPEDIMLGFLIN